MFCSRNCFEIFIWWNKKFCSRILKPAASPPWYFCFLKSFNYCCWLIFKKNRCFLFYTVLLCLFSYSLNFPCQNFMWAPCGWPSGGSWYLQSVVYHSLSKMSTLHCPPHFFPNSISLWFRQKEWTLGVSLVNWVFIDEFLPPP